VYGGGEKCKAFCRKHGLVYVTPVVVMKNKQNQIEKIKENIAFLSEEFKIESSLPGKTEIFNKQIEDFTDMGRKGLAVGQ
jgi:hypothetical protein